ncbi:AGAP011451-PA-like protein [Anopheles sinensis]|uniref:AGAP011451-PA-like protein n=1 Tax=Anopheles sinensis TaxID=74873 RepID=A0A084WBF3_ANOSI|nr:AGAP011451-PA-like protein [Anopheles sinensis]
MFTPKRCPNGLPGRLSFVGMVLVIGLALVPTIDGAAVAANKLEPVRHRWSRSEAMDPNGLYTLDWYVDQKDIVFTATANTRGFMGLGFSHRSERMAGSDLVLVWVDDRTGKPNVLPTIGLQMGPIYFQFAFRVCFTCRKAMESNVKNKSHVPINV